MILRVFVLSIWFLTFTFSTALAGEKVKISSPFNVMEYNTVSNQYGERATFILMNIRDKGDMGWIQADLIHKSDLAQQWGGLDSLRIKEKHVENYISAVDKFLKWEEIARRDKDNFDKEITKVNKVKFSFHSGNEKSHYLVMTFCAVAICVEPSFYYDRKNAVLLKQFLEDWRDDKLNYSLDEEINDKYK